MANTKKNETNEQTALTTVSKSTFDIVAAGQGEAVRATTTDSNRVLFNAVNGQGAKVKDMLGVELTVTNIVVTSADVAKDYSEREKEDAEKVSVPCVHFFTADGQHISSISRGIARAVSKLFECGMQPAEGQPVKLMFTTVSTKNGTAHNFTLLED